MPTIETLLGAPQLIDLIQGVKSGIPRVLPDAFYNLTRNVMSDYASYRKVNGSRRLPKASQYGAPSRVAPQQDITEIPVKLIHTIENQQFGQVILQLLSGFTSVGSAIVPQRMAEDEIARQTVEFKRRFENLRTAAITQAIANGMIWLAADGTFLFNSTGAAVTVNYQTPASNTGTTAALLGAGYTSWDSTATDILGTITALKTLASQATGYPLKYAFYGANVIKYLTANPAASSLIIRNPGFNASLINTGDLPRRIHEPDLDSGL